MLHEQLWHAIDKLAESQHTTCSGLARLSGLDATIFNKSKRTSPVGQPRWVSTETIAKVLVATHTTIRQFVEFFYTK